MKNNRWLPLLAVVVSCLGVFAGLPAAEAQQKAGARGTEISTNEVKQILFEGNIPVIDVRPEKEYAVSHIPGSTNIFETEVDRMNRLCASEAGGVVLYCNGPYCHKTLRVAESLYGKGCTNIKKYQDGLPVWRALGNTAESTISGFKRIYLLDKTAVLIDARSKEEFAAGSVPGAINLRADEIEAANNDGRLPYTDHGTRVIVFGADAGQARQLAEALSHRAYWNSSYLAATYDELKKAGLW